MLEFIWNRSWISRVMLVAQFPLMFAQTVVVGLCNIMRHDAKLLDYRCQFQIDCKTEEWILAQWKKKKFRRNMLKIDSKMPKYTYFQSANTTEYETSAVYASSLRHCFSWAHEWALQCVLLFEFMWKWLCACRTQLYWCCRTCRKWKFVKTVKSKPKCDCQAHYIRSWAQKVFAHCYTHQRQLTIDFDNIFHFSNGFATFTHFGEMN